MAVYSFYCDNHGGFEANGKMENPPKWRRCPDCYRWAQRVYTAPQFTEDRQRLFRNPVDGTNFSWTLGKPMPDTRKAYEKELASLGAEPVSRQTMPESWKQNEAYKKHVESGGERIEAIEKAAHPAAKPGPTVLEQLKKSNVTI